MKKTIITLLILALFLLPISIAQANEDFTANTKSLLSLDAGTVNTNTIKITNTGTQINNYLLTAEGEASEWIQYPTMFSLAPKQSTNVESILTIPYTTETGNYQIITIIATTTGLEKEIIQDIAVINTQNIQLTSPLTSQINGPCQKTTYTINITNPAKFIETYTFSINHPDAKLSETTATLSAGESKQITIDIEPNDCHQIGKYDMIFSAQTEKTNLIAELDLFLEIENTGIPEIAEGISKIKTDYNKNSVDLEIYNTGKNETEYLLTAEGIDWFAITPRLITIEPQKTETITLYTEPTEEVKQGSYPVKITVETVDGAKYEKELTIKLKKPGLIDNLFDKYLPLTILLIIAIIVFGIIAIYTVRYLSSEEYQKWKVQRLKEKEKQRAIKQKEKEARAKEKEKLRKEEEKLKEAARKEKERLEKEKLKQADDRKQKEELEKQRKQKEKDKLEKQLAKKYEREIRKDYVLVAKKEIIQGKSPTNIFTKILFALALLLILAGLIIFNKPIINNITYVLTGLAILVVLYLLVKIRRLSTISAKWRGLTLANETKLFDINWKKGLQQIKFKLNTPIKKLKIWAKKGRGSNERYICIDEHIYQYYRTEANAEANEFEEIETTFKVSKKWLSRKNIDADEVKLYYLDDGEWKEQDTEKINSDSKYVYYTSITDGLGQYAILGLEQIEQEEEETTPKTRILPLLVTLLIAIVLVLLINPTMINTNTTGIPSQKWTQGNEQTIDLNKYFNDPDGDTLSFGIKEEIEGIDVEIVEGIAYLMPAREFTGIETIVFTATDNKGGYAESNPVKLTVLTTMQGLTSKAILLFTYLLGIIIVITGIMFIAKVILLIKRSVVPE